MKSILIKLITTLLLFNFLVASDEQLNQTDITEQNKLSDPKEIEVSDATDDIEDWAEVVREKFKFDNFGEQDGKFLIFAKQTVSLTPLDPQFGDALINAFDKGMMNLQEKYLMIRFGKTTVDKVKTFYQNTSTDAKNIELPKVDPTFFNKIVMLLDKSLDVSISKLDQQLIEMGVDPEEIKKMPETVKKDTFKDKFIKNTMRSASGSIAGLIPVQTKLIIDKKGKAVIGIVAIASHKTIQIAKDISLQRKTQISGKGKSLKTLLPEKNEDFLGVMGARLAYDLDGTPVIISYGFGSYSPNEGDDYINDELRNEAKESAIANADAQIAELINGRMNAKSERQRGEEIRKYVEREVKPNSDTVEKPIKNIINITNKYAKSSASMKLQGVSTLKTWRHTIPNSKVKMVGAVRVWKYSTLESVKKFNETSYKAKETQKSNSDTKSYKKYGSESKVINDVNDF